MPTLISLIIILSLSALNVSKVALQTTFGRRRMQTTADTVLYNLYMFLFAAVIPGLLLLAGGGQISPLTAAAGSAFVKAGGKGFVGIAEHNEKVAVPVAHRHIGNKMVKPFRYRFAPYKICFGGRAVFIVSIPKFHVLSYLSDK